MHMTIKKWGNCLAARILKTIAQSVNLRCDQEVDIEAVNGKIVITPVTEKKEYKLDDLLDQCKPEAMTLDDEDRSWLDAEPVGTELL